MIHFSDLAEAENLIPLFRVYHHTMAHQTCLSGINLGPLSCTENMVEVCMSRLVSCLLFCDTNHVPFPIHLLTWIPFHMPLCNTPQEDSYR